MKAGQASRGTIGESRAEFRDQFTEMSRDDLVRAAEARSYFHDMDFGDVRTGTHVYNDEQSPNYHLHPVFQYLKALDLSGARCFDIGTYDGMTAFVMAEMGAELVTATCQYDLDRFRIARALGGYEQLRYLPMTDIDWTAGHIPAHEHDVVTISAMLHHLISPLQGLLEARRLLATGGAFILETLIVNDVAKGLSLNTLRADPVYGAPTIWLPDEAAVRGMLELACFRVASVTRSRGGVSAREANYDRMTFLCEAVRSGDVAEDGSKTAEILTATRKLGPLDLDVADEAGEARLRLPDVPAEQIQNIWADAPDIPLQPAWRTPLRPSEYRFSIATTEDFTDLVERLPDAKFDWNDVYMLGVNYPGETMPEGMQYSLKQLASVFVLDRIARVGSTEVLEIGAGFNFYFQNHLPEGIVYDCLDDAGFYRPEVIALANAERSRGKALDGLLGRSHALIDDGTYDCCISTSVLEHVPLDEIETVCTDMFRILKPGGWAFHSIDLKQRRMQSVGERFFEAFRSAGFQVGECDLSMQPGSEADPNIAFGENPGIQLRFYAGYKETVWGQKQPGHNQEATHTILVAIQKPVE